MARSVAKPQKFGSRAKRLQRNTVGLLPMTGNNETLLERRAMDELVGRTAAQRAYMKAIDSSKLTFGIGPAGTGKTYVAVVKGADRLMAREIDKLLITRPIVEAGENLGFLPGEMEEKIAPYFAPVLAILERRLGKSQIEALMKTKRIEFMPLAFMRGHTFDNSFIILDGAQNTTPTQMKMFLTRVGEDSTVVVDGDLTQKDLASPSGLTDAFRRLKGMPGSAAVEFTRADVVRSGMVADILSRYEHVEDESDRDALDDFMVSFKTITEIALPCVVS